MVEPLSLLPAAAIPPPQPGDLEVRQAWRRSALIGAVCATISVAALAAPYVAFAAEQRPLAVTLAGWWVGGWIGLLAHAALRAARGARGAGGWVLRLSGDRLLINLRSHLNRHLPAEDATVLVVRRRQVRWLRQVRQRGLRTHVDEEHIHENPTRRRFLDIGLEGETESLEAALKVEGRRLGPGLLGSRSRSNHSALRLLPDGVLRIAWRDETNALVPGLDLARRQLALAFRFVADEATTETSIRAVSAQAQEDRLLALASRGEQMEAVKLARELYGLELTEAVRFVRDLRETRRPG